MARQTYAQRIASAFANARAQGRTITLQEARGKQAGEHKIRAERTQLKAAGLPLPPRAAPRRKAPPPPPPPPRKAPRKAPVTNNGGLLGLSPAERKAVRAYARAQGVRAYKEDDDLKDFADEVVSRVARVGYDRFLAVREMTRRHQAAWRQERRAGDPWPKGRSGLLEAWVAEYDLPEELFYYH